LKEKILELRDEPPVGQFAAILYIDTFSGYDLTFYEVRRQNLNAMPRCGQRLQKLPHRRKKHEHSEDCRNPS
jgi:hypothetical protein